MTFANTAGLRLEVIFPSLFLRGEPEHSLSMATASMLPLQPRSTGRRDRDDLKARIAQIDKQRKGFHNVTEESLLAEIQNSSKDDEDVDMENGDDNEGEDEPADGQATVWKAREEMLQQIDHARNEMLTTLDFVSLLLSKHSRLAESTMSPVLKQNIPSGSLESQAVKPAPLSAESQKRLEAVRQGWKANSFSAAAEKLASAGSRLQEEAQRESRYWEQTSSLKTKGWGISRLSQNSRAVGVHFGFPEATPAFRSRGFALLRRGPAGDIELDRGAHSTKIVAVEVQISVDGGLTMSSTTERSKMVDDSIEARILQAHNSLFEEELFHEMSREARVLANQGVRMSGQSLKFDIGARYNVQIHIRNLDGRTPTSANQSAHNNLADAVSTALRALLGHAHEQNLARRSQAPPPPMSLKQSPIPEYALLRPLMCHLHHLEAVEGLRSFLDTMVPTMKSTGMTFKPSCHTLNDFDPLKSVDLAATPAKSLVEALIGQLKSIISLGLPTSRELKIGITSDMSAPIYGTDYAITPLEYGNTTVRPPRLETASAVEDYLCHVFAADIAVFVSTQPGEPVGEPGLGATSGDVRKPTWRLTDLHQAELLLQERASATRQLQIKVWRDEVGLRYLAKSAKTRTSLASHAEHYLWHREKLHRFASGRKEEVPHKTMLEVVQGLLGTEASGE